VAVRNSQEFGLLVAGNVDGLLETCFGFFFDLRPFNAAQDRPVTFDS
jgi:hypothetical protein